MKLNSSLSSPSCTEATSGLLTITPFGAGVVGADQANYRTVTVTQKAGTTWVYDYVQRLALGASKFSRSSLQSNLWNETLDSAGIGHKRIQLLVNEILPQQLAKDMIATQGSDHVWNVTKSALPRDAAVHRHLRHVDWRPRRRCWHHRGMEETPCRPQWGGHHRDHVYATNPVAPTGDGRRHRPDLRRDGPDDVDTATSGPTDVPANDHAEGAHAHDHLLGHATTFNDVATATRSGQAQGHPGPLGRQVPGVRDRDPAGLTLVAFRRSHGVRARQ